MWSELNIEWKKCFSLAWESFCNGCTPVGAIIVDKDNNTIAESRNGDNAFFHSRISHAEMNALSNISHFDGIDDYALYTSLEPCVMCFSAIYVQKIKKVYYGTRDPHAGGTYLYKSSRYFSIRNMDIVYLQNDEYSFVNAVLLILHEMRTRDPKILSEYLNDWDIIDIAFTNTAMEIRNDIGNKYSINSNIEDVYNYISSFLFFHKEVTTMHVTRDQAILREAKAAKIWNYITEDSGASFSVAFAEVTGNHPESVSNRSDRSYMFVQGTGVMKVGNETFTVAGGDVVYIPKGTKHSLSGNITYYLVNNPPFRKGE